MHLKILTILCEVILEKTKNSRYSSFMGVILEANLVNDYIHQ